ncbi:MAG: SDR family oxidoreductase [Planctomycetaceae bacterium]|jgi:NAD(P)-dependent dehydrogenase (short-subunit alcohol dehydrogenase family)|nr:SDR family oxidoreductase [Planctomycetaceae bacterium]
MKLDLSGRNILITGASSGIGRAISVLIFSAGANVFLLGRDTERLRITAELCCAARENCGNIETDKFDKNKINANKTDANKINANKIDKDKIDATGKIDAGKIVPVTYDLSSDPDDIPKLFQRLAGEYGEFSGLVHSAGIEMARPLRSIKTANLINTYVVNAVSGAMLMKGLSLTGVHCKTGSSAVLISSVSASCGNAGLLCYSMSKGAVESCVKTLAIELISAKIRVNCIAPAMIKTPMTENGTYKKIQELGNDRKDLVELRHPMGFGEPNDVANAALFLLSDKSKYINGITLFADGGYSTL